MNNKRLLGHLLCMACVFVWGTTFISTKVLLVDFTPVEILFFRFLLGLAVLYMCPGRLGPTGIRHEICMALAGLSGVSLYYLLENIALTHTTAANVGIIVSAAPFFTILLSHLLRQEDRLTPAFLAGFLFAITGIGLITITDMSQVHFHPLGDFLAVMAALLWAVYSLLMKKIHTFGYAILPVTRRIFLYGLLFMMPALFLLPFSPHTARFSNPVNLGNFLYLGICACAVCFCIWNYALKLLGTMTASVYIYAMPVITMAASALILHEPVTIPGLAGALLTITGLMLSENRLPIIQVIHRCIPPGNSQEKSPYSDPHSYPHTKHGKSD